jgi:hypothetical protein
MAQPNLDDGVENLENFCNLLGQTSAVLTRDTEVLEARGDSLEQTEAETRARAERVGEHLAIALEELTAAQDDALEEVDGLTDTAEKLAAARLQAAGDRLESGEASFEERLSHDRAQLEKSFLDLSESGFMSLGAAIDDVETELARAGEGSGHALESLEGGLTKVGRQVAEERSEMVGVLEAADEAIREGEVQELEQQGLEHFRLWTEELPETVRAECVSVAEPLEALYGEWEAEVVAEGDELGDAVADLLQSGAEMVTDEAGQPLASAVEEATNDALGALISELDGLLPVLDEGEPAAEAAAALVDDLVVAREVVSVVDRLLKALVE